MFRITEDPSSGSLEQCLAKITKMVVSCPLTWTWSVLCQRTRYNYSCNFSQALYKAPWWWILCDPKYVGEFFNIL